MLTTARSSLNPTSEGIDASFTPGVDADGLGQHAAVPRRAPNKLTATIPTRMGAIVSALCEIPEHHREAFELTAVDGLSLEAAAAITDTTPTTLKMRKHYARTALRDRLGDELEELLR